MITTCPHCGSEHFKNESEERPDGSIINVCRDCGKKSAYVDGVQKELVDPDDLESPIKD